MLQADMLKKLGPFVLSSLKCKLSPVPTYWLASIHCIVNKRYNYSQLQQIKILPHCSLYFLAISPVTKAFLSMCGTRGLEFSPGVVSDTLILAYAVRWMFLTRRRIAYVI